MQSSMAPAIANVLLCSFCFIALLASVSLTSLAAEDRAIYLVLMEGDSVAFNGGSPSSRLDLNSEASKAHAKRLADSHDQLLQSNLEIGSYSKLYSFKHIANGFAVHTTPSQAEKLKSAPRVKMVERDRGAKLMTTYTPQFLQLPQGVWRQEGGQSNAGDGIVIGFVDTGINPLHLSFAYNPLSPFTSNISHFSGACETGPLFPPLSCNGKIVSAKYFSAGARAVATLNATRDFLSPFDADGHGSHVASIAAGNAGVPVVVNGYFYGQASGMAPRARIAVYKAVYPTVATLADVVSAMDQAIRDGVDVLVLSVGPDEPPEDRVTFLNMFDIFMLHARRAGVFVVQAAGNRGPDPLSVVSYSPWAVGAASSSTDRVYTSSMVLGNGARIEGVGLTAPTLACGLLQHRLVLARDAINPLGLFPRTAPYIEECQYPQAFDLRLVVGSIVICTFSEGFSNGTSTINGIVNTARTLGMMGFVLVANPVYGNFIAEPVPFSVSGIMVPSVAQSQALLQYYEQQTRRGFFPIFGARASIGDGRAASFMGQAPTVSRFSSRGPDFLDRNRKPADVLKPDILAPGHQIWGAWSPMSAIEPSLLGQSFALLSGTSMATPHVAGIAALIKQYHPSWTPSMIASAISTTAAVQDKTGQPIMAERSSVGSQSPATPFDFGAGFINPSRALDPGLVLSSGYDDYISFLCSLHNDTNPGLIKAVTGKSCTCALEHPANLNHPSVTISALKGSRLVRRVFMSVETTPETYSSTVMPPKGTTVSICPPSFTIAPQGTREISIQFNVTQPMSKFTFGEIVLRGSLNHIVRIPLSVYSVCA